MPSRWFGLELGRPHKGSSSTGSMYGAAKATGVVSIQVVGERISKRNGAPVKSQVNTQWGSARLAGTKAPTVFVGDVVEVCRGEDVGFVTEVLDVIGHAYRSDNRVIVRNSQGELVFYLPWDLNVVKRERPSLAWVE